MFNQEYTPSKREKVPTLLQYLKSLPKNSKALQQVFQVEIIWLPSKFDNVTLETHAFRITLREDHPLYASLLAEFAVGESYKDFTAFGIRIKDREAATFEVEPMSSKKGRWSALGANGRRFDV